MLYAGIMLYAFQQWRSQTFSDGGAHFFLSMISYWHAGSYVHLLEIVVCTKNALAINSSKTNVKA